MSPSSRRAWIEIPLVADDVLQVAESPSSRRAWIEIAWLDNGWRRHWSPSSRRAWIEMELINLSESARDVALLAEGVDRNYFSVTQSQ